MMKMHDRLLRRREVEEITGLSRSTIYRLMDAGEFPQAKSIGPNCVRWLLSEIIAWMESRPLARGRARPPNAA